MVDKVLNMVDGLADGPAAASILVEDAQRGVSRTRRLDASNVLAISEAPVRIHGAHVVLGITQETIVSNAESTASAVDAQRSRCTSHNDGGQGENVGSVHGC